MLTVKCHFPLIIICKSHYKFIAGKIVEQQGGKIIVNSAPDRGSLFRFSSPIVIL
jgi:hypothetical protein